MATTRSSPAARRPTVDEWGVYDPQQAGLAALYTRLADATESRRPDAASDPAAEPAATATARASQTHAPRG